MGILDIVEANVSEHPTAKECAQCNSTMVDFLIIGGAYSMSSRW